MGSGQGKTRCAYPWQQIVIDVTGEVVPCCFYSAYGGENQKPFGNTNKQTLEEIWNGPGFQDLRRRHVEGDLDGHPCDKCVAYYWNNHDYPKFQWPSGVVPESGKAYIAKISEKFQQTVAGHETEVRLFEDDGEIGPGNALHDDIREHGGGSYSVWNGTLYFSTPDGSDPITNGRSYELRWGEHAWEIARFVRDSDSGRNLQAAYGEYRSGATGMEAKPTMLTWSSTADCNIDCGYCSQNMYRAVKLQHRAETEEAVLRLVPQLIYFSWAGGEPYFLKNFRKFVDEFDRDSNPNLTFGFTSNATHVSRQELEKLEKFPRISASFSVDSFVPETFETLRKGASFKRVMGNMLGALATNDAPDRSFVCGQLVMKSNFLELPTNVRFALEHGIGVNFSPVTTYPVHERIDVFSDFAAQTAGWREALDEAMALAEKARDDGALAMQRVDMLASLSAVKAIFERVEERYRETAPIVFRVEDPYWSLPKMPMPGIQVLFERRPEIPLTYVLLDRGPGTYVGHAPVAEVGTEKILAWEFMADVQEPWVRHIEAHLKATDGRAWHKSELRDPAAANMAIEHVVIREYEAPVRERNAKLSNAGLPTSGGLETQSEDEMWLALRRLEAAEKRRSMPERAKRQPIRSVLERSSAGRMALRHARRIFG